MDFAIDVLPTPEPNRQRRAHRNSELFDRKVFQDRSDLIKTVMVVFKYLFCFSALFFFRALIKEIKHFSMYVITRSSGIEDILLEPVDLFLSF